MPWAKALSFRRCYVRATRREPERSGGLGGLSEWSMVADLKSAEPKRLRGFESLTLRKKQEAASDSLRGFFRLPRPLSTDRSTSLHARSDQPHSHICTFNANIAILSLHRLSGRSHYCGPIGSGRARRAHPLGAMPDRWRPAQRSCLSPLGPGIRSDRGSLGLHKHCGSLTLEHRALYPWDAVREQTTRGGGDCHFLRTRNKKIRPS